MKPPRAPTGAFGSGFEIAFAPERMKHRVERARTDTIFMPGQLLDHPMPMELALDGMMKDMQPDEAGGRS
jgi:hypothetical protein